MATIPTLAEQFAKTQHTVTHLEMRDTYGVNSIGYQAWCKGVPIEEISQYDYLRPWVGLVAEHVARGVTFRRARIISEPVSDYIRYEHGITPAANLIAGEQVRWLPRPQARDLALPGCDFWQFDRGLVRFAFQDGDGDKAGNDLSDDPTVIELCASAFEAVWERALDHQEYRPA